MPEIPLAVWILAILYAAAAVTLGDKPDAPLTLRWPCVVWDLIAHAWRTPTAPALRPDYARIAFLERELGMAVEQPEKPMCAGTVCLVKDCDGDTYEVRTWSGQLATRIHQH